MKVTKKQKACFDVIETLPTDFRPVDVFQHVKHAVSRAVVDSTLQKLRNEGAVENPQFGMYKKTKEWKKFYSQKFTVTEHGAAGYSKRAPKSLPAPEPAAPAINMSVSADNLAENISAVIKENSDYRNLLLSVHEIIGKALGLDQTTTEE